VYEYPFLMVLNCNDTVFDNNNNNNNNNDNNSLQLLHWFL
jgi:hypothetical protein